MLWLAHCATWLHAVEHAAERNDVGLVLGIIVKEFVGSLDDSSVLAAKIVYPTGYNQHSIITD